MGLLFSERDKLSPDDISQLANFHVEALGESVLSMAGRGYIRKFYEYIIKSSEEVLFIKKDGDDITGAAIVSKNSKDLSRRLFFNTPFIFFFIKHQKLSCIFLLDFIV